MKFPRDASQYKEYNRLTAELVELQDRLARETHPLKRCVLYEQIHELVAQRTKSWKSYYRTYVES